jgi:hypothetical protein
MLPSRAGTGHWYVILTKDGEHKIAYLHKLVAKHHLSPPPFEEAIVRHGPAGKDDNSATNLFWGSLADNSKDRIRDGTDAIGEHNGNATVTEDDVREIRRLREEEGWTYERLGTKFGISSVQASNIARRKFWKHIA